MNNNPTFDELEIYTEEKVKKNPLSLIFVNLNKLVILLLLIGKVFLPTDFVLKYENIN